MVHFSVKKDSQSKFSLYCYVDSTPVALQRQGDTRSQATKKTYYEWWHVAIFTFHFKLHLVFTIFSTIFVSLLPAFLLSKAPCHLSHLLPYLFRIMTAFHTMFLLIFKIMCLVYIDMNNNFVVHIYLLSSIIYNGKMYVYGNSYWLLVVSNDWWLTSQSPLLLRGSSYLYAATELTS